MMFQNVVITATNYAELSRRHDVRVVGNIPTEFPPPSLPRFYLIRHIGLNAAAIAITAIALSRRRKKKHTVF
ncbi:unnamed protein product [Caenorhabditis angaria]|uniref:SLC26A/SulP transporter domain-containing protein n=1 Tax=Caenorhabditis angaria TaxID=860376 RepID=A0A9P1J182_9PELO|nr:unnamed protein product [Caenorhabditis angaria]